MLIGIDANEANLTPNRVGVNQYAFELLHALYNLKTQHTFVIYLKTPPLADLPKPKPNWTYRIIPFPKFWTQTRLPLDLFTHTPRPKVFFSMTHYAPRWSPIPTVVSIMDLGFLRDPSQFKAKDLNQLKSWTKYSITNAKRVIAISEFTKKDIEHYYHKNPDTVKVTLLSYNANLFKPTNQPQILNKYGITKPYFLFLSSLKPSKNVTGLLRAFHDFKDKKYSLVIVGKKAWLYDQIFKLANDLGISERVIFTGFVDEIDKPALMTEAASFVLPSFFEGFGIPVLEAMACGTPVVVSKVASLPEVVADAGIYVNPSDTKSITTGLTTSVGPLRDQFVKKGLNRVKSFSWITCAQQTLKIIEDAV